MTCSPFKPKVQFPTAFIHSFLWDRGCRVHLQSQKLKGHSHLHHCKNHMYKQMKREHFSPSQPFARTGRHLVIICVSMETAIRRTSLGTEDMWICCWMWTICTDRRSGTSSCRYDRLSLAASNWIHGWQRSRSYSPQPPRNACQHCFSTETDPQGYFHSGVWGTCWAEASNCATAVRPRPLSVHFPLRLIRAGNSEAAESPAL